jgi:small subunit ribosomal protein S24e
MELEIVSRKDNPLLDRIELEVLAHHAGEPTPKREEIREQVAAAVKAKKDQVLVDHMDSTFGTGSTRGYVKVYNTKEAALAIERAAIIKRNRLDGAGKKDEPAKPKEAPKPEEPEEPDQPEGPETADEGGD